MFYWEIIPFLSHVSTRSTVTLHVLLRNTISVTCSLWIPALIHVLLWKPSLSHVLYEYRLLFMFYCENHLCHMCSLWISTRNHVLLRNTISVTCPLWIPTLFHVLLWTPSLPHVFPMSTDHHSIEKYHLCHIFFMNTDHHSCSSVNTISVTCDLHVYRPSFMFYWEIRIRSHVSSTDPHSWSIVKYSLRHMISPWRPVPL
jgi:type IV secretory pathway TrbD component